MSSADLSRVLVVHNRDYEGADADPENRARADVLSTAEGVRAALERLGHPVDLLGVGGDLDGVLREIATFEPAVVFNLCESIDGISSLEPLMPLLLERAGLSYTGSPPLTLGLAVHKHKAKDVLRGAGVPTPEAVLMTTSDVSRIDLPFPLIVKPGREDASVGITLESVVHDRAALERQVTFILARYRQPALVERYVEGREIYVSMLERPEGGVEVLPLYEIDFAEMPAGAPRIVSFDGKWVESSPEFNGTKPVACALAPDLMARLTTVAETAFAAMELRDYARLDIRLDAAGTPYVIDVNPNCDLSDGAGFARAARAAGLGYDAVIGRIVELALQRRPHADTIPFTTRPRAHRLGVLAEAGAAPSTRAARGARSR
ncbi:MAG TPA: D-alanine--D-alanine ligase [Polyangia bacterium]|nr:D-alanine--D-alanine ligase [Polyangia bacterium]